MQPDKESTDDFRLMTGPSRSSKSNERTITRTALEYIDKVGTLTSGSGAERSFGMVADDFQAQQGQRFRLGQITFASQFAQVYFFRLQRMASQMRKKAAARWKDVPIVNVLDLPENTEAVVIGTLYKEMKLKPSILAEYAKDRGLEQLIGKSKFVDPSDYIVLEDTSARIQLGGVVPTGDLVTGVIAAVKGVATLEGKFQATEIIFFGPKPQPPLPPPGEGSAYVALVSGLHIDEVSGNPTLLSLLIDFLTGMLGSVTEQTMASQIVRTVIAGGLMSTNEVLASAATHTDDEQQKVALGPVRLTDMALTELAGTMPVNIMPGASDPAAAMLPQQPLHSCLFPGAASFETVSRVTNPHEFEVGGVSFLGTSGQNVDDVYKYSGHEDRLAILEAILEWGHLAPTAPDTLSSYPFAMDDPFILDSTPHVLFAGNQPEFETRMYTGPEGQRARLICLPRFEDSSTVVLVNVHTLDVHPIQFNA